VYLRIYLFNQVFLIYMSRVLSFRQHSTVGFEVSHHNIIHKSTWCVIASKIRDQEIPQNGEFLVDKPFYVLLHIFGLIYSAWQYCIVFNIITYC